MLFRSTEVCEELRKRRMDVCCLQEVRWRGQGAQFMGVKDSNISCGGLQGIVMIWEVWEFW